MTTPHPYDKHYFHGGGKVGGYAGSGYRDFPVHWATYAHVMKRAPESVLELGCGRGYLVKRFEDYAEIPALGLEISEHCRLTRATESVCTFDVTQAPWPIDDRTFDLCLSMAFLEHVPEDRLPTLFNEMTRTCKRGLHGIDIHDGDGFDRTHCTIRPLAWWKERLPPGHEAVNKDELEAGPIILPSDLDRGVKLNLGSFTHMFHGWKNIDRLNLAEFAAGNGYSFIEHDLTRPLPYDAHVVDLIFLSHVLEHFDYAAGIALLRECRRVLKPHGVLRVAVPNASKLIRLYEDGRIQTLTELCGSDVTEPAVLLHELMYGGDHRAIYDHGALVHALDSAGFANVTTSAFRCGLSPAMRRETIDLYPELSLFVEATP